MYKFLSVYLEMGIRKRRAHLIFLLDSLPSPCSFVSIRQGVRDLGGGVVDVIEALIGLPQKVSKLVCSVLRLADTACMFFRKQVSKWDSETIAQIGQCYEKQDLLKALTLICKKTMYSIKRICGKLLDLQLECAIVPPRELS